MHQSAAAVWSIRWNKGVFWLHAFGPPSVWTRERTAQTPGHPKSRIFQEGRFHAPTSPVWWLSRTKCQLCGGTASSVWAFPITSLWTHSPPQTVCQNATLFVLYAVASEPCPTAAELLLWPVNVSTLSVILLWPNPAVAHIIGTCAQGGKSCLSRNSIMTPPPYLLLLVATLPRIQLLNTQ